VYYISKDDLNSPTKFNRKLQGYLQTLKEKIRGEKGVDFEVKELGELILSACRTNDFDVIDHRGDRMLLNESRVLHWVEEKLLPNTVILSIDDEDVIRLLIFCIEITYRMFAGGTRATTTQKGFRERRRTFESILIDQFVGKLGEIMVKRYLEENFHATVDLDWEITTHIERYRNDIVNAKRNVSIKSSPSLAGAWAEAGIGYDYGIAVKCSVPQPTILQFFIEVCGFSRLLDFAENRIPPSDELFKSYLGSIRERIKGYKCGEVQTKLKGFICGYFKTSDYEPVGEGVVLDYLGKVREERYIVPLSKLKFTKDDWIVFLKDTGLSHYRWT
jgi:hypothetical protein